MGVTGLWQIVQPCARPIKIETLNRKRLAVDASIWIYQFLKAVRDKEGNALRNSHVVGFFRRICKLLFFGIKPVFVFDGGAPALKRQTIRSRKARREGRREDAVRTAGKLLAVQMQRRAEEEEALRKAERDRVPEDEEEEEVPDVYADELQRKQQEAQQNRNFRKKDQYHLPDLDVSLSEMGGPDDLRVMSLEELQAYARQFDTGEDINVYDFSKIDYDSPFFMSLPPSDRYNILNAARLRSRLRMGHSKEQLDSMFPDRMAFSKFQIERVRERNELTQRLMHLNGFETMEFGGGRVAGEKGREYVLVKNDGVEGGWALGVISDEGKQEKPIDIDRPALVKDESGDDEWEDDDDFEDIPIEGLNRLPKKKSRNEQVTDELMRQRRAVYSSKKQSVRKKRNQNSTPDPDSLFVRNSEDEGEEDQHEISGTNEDLFDEEDNEELQRAIAMSLETDDADPSSTRLESDKEDAEDDDMLEVFQQKAVDEQRPVPKGSGRDIASIVNQRAFKTAPESREITSFGVPTMKPDDSDGDDDTVDFQAALAQSRRNKRKTGPPLRQETPREKIESATEIAKKAGFKGPLPFEKLDLGSSLLGKKKLQQRTEETAGGFENPELAQKEQRKAEPLPPWFAGNLEEDIRAQEAIESNDRRKAREYNEHFQFQEREQAIQHSNRDEVIDLEAETSNGVYNHVEIIDVEANEQSVAPKRVDHTASVGDLADESHAEPGPEGSMQNGTDPDTRNVESELQDGNLTNVNTEHWRKPSTPQRIPVAALDVTGDTKEQKESPQEDEEIEWSESDTGNDGLVAPSDTRSLGGPNHKEVTKAPQDESRAGGSAMNPSHEPVQAATTYRSDHDMSRSPSVEAEDIEFEDIGIPDAPPATEVAVTDGFDISPVIEEEDDARPASAAGQIVQDSILEYDEEFDDFSDPEDAEILRALTLEAEEHARFASSLNNKSQAQNVQDYERELKQLRNQQKKDRRDADEVTQIMIQECQALLRLFGLPYITAPMEAEAQCAELVRLGLVDGIVTDDSDCFLFGGTRIYKNMFNQAKFVECYLTSDLEKEFALSRDKLIAVAHLLGSDYTEGLPGIGPVSAIEIVSEFQTLEAFKEWWSAVQMNQIPKSEDANHPFRKKFRRNATKLFLPPAFPDQRVNLAYQNPEVDADPEPFQWGIPDLDALRSFLMSTIGWSQERTDEVLVPVIKDMNRRADEGTQANITHFFDGTVGLGAVGRSNNSTAEGFAPRKRLEGSKRMGSALTKMAERAKLNRNDSASDEYPPHNTAASHASSNGNDSGRTKSTGKASRKRRAARAASPPAGQSNNDDDDDDDAIDEDSNAQSDSDERPQKRPKKRGKGQNASRQRKNAANRQV